jgi:hypothetical protein
MSRLPKVKPVFVLADILASLDEDDEDDAALDELLKPCPLNLSQGSGSSNEQSPPSRKNQKKIEETQEELEARGSCALILPSLSSATWWSC